MRKILNCFNVDELFKSHMIFLPTHNRKSESGEARCRKPQAWYVHWSCEGETNARANERERGERERGSHFLTSVLWRRNEGNHIDSWKPIKTAISLKWISILERILFYYKILPYQLPKLNHLSPHMLIIMEKFKCYWRNRKTSNL